MIERAVPTEPVSTLDRWVLINDFAKKVVSDEHQSLINKRVAWLNLAELSEEVRRSKDLEVIKRNMPQIVYSEAKTKAFYRHVLELDPQDYRARRAYERLTGKTFDETVLARLPDEEYEPAAYLPVSPRLREPLKTPLKEDEEVSWYWGKQVEEDKKFIEAMDKQIANPMDPHCRMSIGIPSYMEGKNIFRTLETFAKQEGVDPREFEIIVFENHPASTVRDDTKQEIQRFQKLYPHLRVNHAYFMFPNMVPMGTIRKIVFDLSLLRSIKRTKQDNKQELIIASSDADSYGMKGKALRYIIDTFDKRKEIELLTGKWDFPKEALVHFPTVHALMRFIKYHQRISERYFGKYRKTSSGACSFFRLGTYAAIGGYDYKIKRGSDTELGTRISYYRKDHAIKSMTHAHRIFTDPRRSLSKMVVGRHWIDQWQDIDWQNDKRVVGKSWKEFKEKTLVNFNKNRLEIEINAFLADVLNRINKNPNKHTALLQLRIIDRTMKFLGINYKIIGNKISLQDTSKLEEGLKKFKEENLQIPKREISNNTEKKSVYILTRGKSISLEYDSKRPIIVTFPGGTRLRIVGARELKSLESLHLPEDHFIIVNFKLFNETKGQKGYKDLGTQETVELGKTQKASRLDFGPALWDNHVRIKRDGKTITITDLNSKNGTLVEGG